MNIFILLLSWFGLLAGAELPPPPPPVTGEGGGCPSSTCGGNGTRVTGLAVELPGDLGAVTLPSGERVTLR